MLAFPPDVTFLIQLVSFFVLLWILQRLLFAPFADVIAERERRTHGAREHAVKIQSQAQSLSSTIARGLAEARGLALAQAEAIRRDAHERETVILNAAKQDAAERLTALRGAIAQERERAATTLHAEAAGLAHAMVDAVLKPMAARARR